MLSLGGPFLGERPCHVAVDLGAESGRVMLGVLDEAGVHLAEVTRFTNGPVETARGPAWDTERLVAEIVAGLRRIAEARIRVTSLGIDTWGVDFGLLDESGRSLFAPYHYRHPRTAGWPERLAARVDPAKLYAQTGVQAQAINTLYQLCALHESDPEACKRAKHLLLMPSWFVHRFTGCARNEFTIATTSQCFNPSSGDWAFDMLEQAGLPTHFFGPIAPPATKAGPLTDEMSQRTSLEGLEVVYPASHDTASAVAAIPVPNGDFAFISSGTWSLMGMLVERPVLSEEARTLGFSNEGGAAGDYRLLRNITGLWLLQRCQKAWSDAGHPRDYSEIVRLASQSRSGQALFDPDHSSLVLPADMPTAIRALCRSSGQAEPADDGALSRSIFESLACKYRQTLDRLAQLTGHRPEEIHVVGGGSQNALLAQLTADLCGCRVLAGPTETTTLGNALAGAVACGIIANFAEGRRLVRRNHEPVEYQPGHADRWNDLYTRYVRLWG